FEREWRDLAGLRQLPAVTRDGVEITLEANLELPVELPQALANGAMGLGLVRSEFLYMNRDDLPSEDEQYAIFSALVRGMEGRPVTVRTFDLGREKIAPPPRPSSPRPAVLGCDGRGAGCRACRRRALGRVGFFRNRHQRPDPIRLVGRPQRRAGRLSLPPAVPGGIAAHSVRDRGRVASR